MDKLLICTVILGAASSAFANYNGPFLLWGHDDLKKIDLPSLSQLDESVLRNIYAESSAIILFVRNGTSRLSQENYPSFRNIINQNTYKYLPQYWLPADPVDFNVNAEVINLVGPTSQQDIELAAFYKDAVLSYGEGKVLGILATKSDVHDHEISKRQAQPVPEDKKETASTTTENPEAAKEVAPEEKQDEALVYHAKGKALLYTTAAPVLTEGEYANVTELKSHLGATGDTRDLYSFLVVVFKQPNGLKNTIRFKFLISKTYWSLVAAELGETPPRNTLNVVGTEPSAPIGFSYACARPLVFRNGTTILTLKSIQVQPALDNSERFGNAYDCVGFTTAPIWSGVLVSLFVSFIVMVSIVCIMDIKPPNRFESNRGKQLTFTIQE